MADTPVTRSPVSGGDCFAALLLTIIAVDIGAIFGDRGVALDIPAAGLFGMVAPVGVFFSMLCLPFLLPRTGRLGWSSVLPGLLAMLFVALPYGLWRLSSTTFPLPRQLSHEEIQDLRRVLEMPMLVTYDGPPPRGGLHIRTANVQPEVLLRIEGWLERLPVATAIVPGHK